MDLGRRDELAARHARQLTALEHGAQVVVVRRERGMGTSTFVDRLHAELLVSGVDDLYVIDEPSRPSRHELLQLRDAIAANRACRVVIVSDRPDVVELLLGMVARVEHVGLEPLSDGQARELIEQLGIDPWSLDAARLLTAGAGVPGRIIDAVVQATGQADWTPLVERPAGARDMPLLVGAWRQARARGDVAGGDALVARARRSSDADAAALCAEQAFAAGRCMTAAAASDDGVGRQWLELFEHAAAALDGDKRAALLLHATAGSRERHGMPASAARAWQLVALVAHDQGDLAGALRAVRRAIVCADGAQLLLTQLELRLELARMHAAARDASRALRYAEEVVRAAGMHGLRGMHDEAMRCAAPLRLRGSMRAVPIDAGQLQPAVLRRSGSRDGPRQRLTPRERQVAQFVAVRMTNAEIANELELSQRTVEHHVASILRKLELPNRRALSISVV